MSEDILITEFERIKKRGWIKSCRKGFSGVGYTFEKLIGIEENRFPYPDYFGIEIKTRRNNTKYFSTLFNSRVKGEEELELNRLRMSYGYPDKIIKEQKVLQVSVYGSKISKIGVNYSAKLFVNYSAKVVNLLIYERNGSLLDASSYWKFEDLKESLFNKCRTIAFIGADKKFFNGSEYFKYVTLDIYKLKSFNAFLNLIERGIIRVSFRAGIFRTGVRKGEIHDHGTAFEIYIDDIEKLYDKIY